MSILLFPDIWKIQETISVYLSMANKDHRDVLIDKIRTITDKNVLDEVYRLLSVSLDDSVYHLNAEQEAEIAQAREEISSGQGRSSEQIEKEFDEWLNK